MSTVLAGAVLVFSFGSVCGTTFLDTDLLKLFNNEVRKLQGNETRCIQDLKEYLNGFEKFEEWAMRMYDSSSKIPVGFLSGNMKQLGSFDECLAVNNNEQIRGQHCIAKIDVPKSIYGNTSKENTDRESVEVEDFLDGRPAWWSICTPDSCKANDLQNIFDKILTGDFNVTFIEDRCQSRSKEKPLTAGAWGTLALFIIIFILVVLSTVYDLWLHSKKKDSIYPILLAFSAYTNGKKIITINKNQDQLYCIHGIKAISMFWIIMFHVCYELIQMPVMNFRNVVQWQYERWYSIIILNGHMAVDTFLTINAILLVYTFMKGAERKVNFNIPLFYVHRYLRLTPALLVLILISVTLVPYVGSGPLWPEIYDKIEKPCQHEWWAVLLYIHNYITDKGECIMHSWYLALDMQLLILSPLLLIPLRKWPKATLSMISALLIVSIIIPFYNVWVYELKGFFFMDIADYIHHYYFPTHCRFGTWLIGFIAGYITFKTRQKKIVINKYLGVFLWITFFGVMFSTLLGGFNTLQHGYIQLESSIYVVLSKFAWSIGVCWLIFACVHGYGWIINDILCLPVFQILSNLCYTTYLSHYYVQQFMLYSGRSPITFGDVNMFHRFLGDLFFALFFAAILCLGFELPMIVIDRILFRNEGKKKTTPIHNLKMRSGQNNSSFLS